MSISLGTILLVVLVLYARWRDSLLAAQPLMGLRPVRRAWLGLW